MKTTKTSALFLIPLAALLCFGCKHDEEEITDTAPTKVAFDGAPDPKLAGTWKTEGTVATYTLDAAGTYKLDQKIQVSKQKPIDSHLTGSWGVKGDQMLFKDQSGNVAGYGYKLDGTKLTLVANGTLKSKIVMDKQP